MLSLGSLWLMTNVALEDCELLMLNQLTLPFIINDAICFYNSMLTNFLIESLGI